MCLLVLLSPFELLAFLQFICCKLLLSFWSVSADLFRLAFYLAFSFFSLWTICASHFNISHFITSSPLDSSWIFKHCHFVHVLPFILCSLFHIYAIFEKKHELRFNSLRTPVQQNGQILACYRYSEIPRHALHESSAELSLPDAAGAANAGPLKHFQRFVCNKVIQSYSNQVPCIDAKG